MGLHGWNIAFDASAQLQLPAQYPQLRGDRADFLGAGRILRQPSVQTVKVGTVARQGVELCLQCVHLHGQLFRAVDPIFPQIVELLLIAVKADDLIP